MYRFSTFQQKVMILSFKPPFRLMVSDGYILCISNKIKKTTEIPFVYWKNREGKLFFSIAHIVVIMTINSTVDLIGRNNSEV